MAKYKLSREMYRDIKKMSAEEMAQFLENVFNEGVKSAIKNTESVSVKQLHDAISNIKGIGESRMKIIDTVIIDLFKKGNVNE